MRKILAIITVLLFLLLLWYSHGTYQDCCNNKKEDVIEQEKVTPVTRQEKETSINKDGSLLFNWNSDIAHENKFWNTKKASILSGISDGKILKILGPYFKDEGKDMGIKRAKAAYNKIADKMNIQKVEFGSNLLSDTNDYKTKPFAGTKYLWLVRNNNITEVDNKALIYFPSNSTKKINNVNIKNYLKNVVNNLKNNSKKVYLSGHSDSRGNAILNKKLALGRANSIKNELVRLGLDASRISTVSFGEEKPIASNNTKEGQQKNRRVELEIK